jgi:hypothetical protein
MVQSSAAGHSTMLHTVIRHISLHWGGGAERLLHPAEVLEQGAELNGVAALGVRRAAYTRRSGGPHRFGGHIARWLS